MLTVAMILALAALQGKRGGLSALLALWILAGADPAHAQADSRAAEGMLTIAGGALAADNVAVWRAFLAGKRKAGPIVVVPAASGSPRQSAASATAALIRHGASADEVLVAPLALRDDRSTREVNEATWANNTDDPELVEVLSGASAFWFTGGDQARISKLLFNDDGTPSRALTAIRQAAAGGAGVGGTSAGAAVMSESMILQGDALTALTGSNFGEPLKIGRGLGFFHDGLVDQHFGERARLGRLVAALLQIPERCARIGYGIDENTALIVNGTGSATVLGAGYVTVIDARSAQLEDRADARLQLIDLKLHLLASGDRIELSNLAIDPASWRKSTIGVEYYEDGLLNGSGMALAGQTLQEVLGVGLLDTRATKVIERISFDAEGRGVGFRFSQTPESRGAWGRGPAGATHYSVSGVTFDVFPIDVELKTPPRHQDDL